MTQTQKMRRIRAFRESVADTSVAFAINVPLNFALVWFAFQWQFSAWQTSIMLTTIFTIFAVIRKTYIRLHFEKTYQKTCTESASKPK